MSQATDNVVEKFRAHVLERILHWRERNDGLGHVAGFIVDIDALETRYVRTLTDLAASGENVTAATAAIGDLADEVSNAATQASKVELPAFTYDS